MMTPHEGFPLWRFQMMNHREFAFEEILDALNAGILLTDDDAGVLYMNAAAKHQQLAMDPFSMLIRRIRSLRPRSILGRPALFLDFQRQSARKPARCHRRTVSG